MPGWCPMYFLPEHYINKTAVYYHKLNTNRGIQLSEQQQHKVGSSEKHYVFIIVVIVITTIFLALTKCQALF